MVGKFEKIGAQRHQRRAGGELDKFEKSALLFTHDRRLLSGPQALFFYRRIVQQARRERKGKGREIPVYFRRRKIRQKNICKRIIIYKR